ncbi:hypothetical protein [Streptomyces sp. NPDC007905]|uniref:hypothetical protein n=1 Tax=Streptomyces sp. NPDC007905 TaxID=3364788 RepID=UPI0036E261F5
MIDRSAGNFPPAGDGSVPVSRGGFLRTAAAPAAVPVPVAADPAVAAAGLGQEPGVNCACTKGP